MKLVRGKRYKIFTPGGRMLFVDIYPVGILDEIQNSWRCKQYKMSLGDIWIYIRTGNWHAIRLKFNGYLAEPDVMPGELKRCGSGWTRKRALRDLQRRVKKHCLWVVQKHDESANMPGSRFMSLIIFSTGFGCAVCATSLTGMTWTTRSGNY